MKNQINPRDYELISAYLDNQLGSEDRAIFEERLIADPQLRDELKEINTTRSMLRSLPRHRAPRNYYVTAQVVRTRPTPKLAPIFGIVSAAASVLLAIMIFGSTFVNPTIQVAMAPAAPVSNDAVAPQEEIVRSAASPITPTEAAPSIMMGAPILETPTPFVPQQNIAEAESATPTTIYVYVYPPTETPINPFLIAIAPTETPTISCEEYWSLPIPSSADIFLCPTPTGTLSMYLESILSTPTSTSTISPTHTTSPTQSPTMTPSPTETPSATNTPTLTETPTPSDTPLPAAIEAPSAAQKLAPSGGMESSTQTGPPAQTVGSANSTQPVQDLTQPSNAAADYSFLNYLLLTIELSLAAVAVIAGVTAIILRIRAR